MSLIGKIGEEVLKEVGKQAIQTATNLGITTHTAAGCTACAAQNVGASATAGKTNAALTGLAAAHPISAIGAGLVVGSLAIGGVALSRKDK